jgi:putative endonuclease
LRATEESAAIPKRMNKQYYVYMMTNKINTVIYTGVTSGLEKRVYEHKHKMVDGFTKKYNITKLVYYEVTDDVKSAIEREKQIKAGSRDKKLQLVDSVNPKWKDLYSKL